jgi:hypothetical protein
MIGKIPARPSLFLSPSLPLIVPLLRISYTVFYCRPTHRDQVRRGHRRGAAMQRPGARLRLAVGQCHALMLAQVLDPVLHEEGFDIAGWVGRIMEQLPAQGAVPKAFQAHLPHARAKSPACIISMWYSSANVKARSDQGVVTPVSVNVPSTAAAAIIHSCMARSNRRRSTTSANAPAGWASRKNGRLVAVCMRATMMGEGTSEVINHTPPTSCIHVPMFEATDAIHSERKRGCRRGLQADVVSG